MSEPLNQNLQRIQSLREAILAIGHRYGVRNVRLFGSVARRAAQRHSDVDILVDIEQGRSLLDLVGFEQDVSELLGCQVDVVVEGGISPHFEHQVLRDAVPL